MEPADHPTGQPPGELDDAIAPGGAIRFDVSDRQRRSAVWRIWTKDTNNDVYAAAREVAGHIKVSLHESGWWQHGFVSDDEAKGFRLPQQRRQFAVWRRPAELVPGWTRAVQIVVPDASLQVRASRSTAKKPVLDISTAGAGDTTVVEFWLESPEPHQPLNLGGSRAIARLRQPDDTIVWVVARRLALPWDPCQRFGEYVTAAHDAAIEQQPDRTGNEPLSICVHDPDHPTSDFILWELAVTVLVQKNSSWHLPVSSAQIRSRPKPLAGLETCAALVGIIRVTP